MIGSGYQSAGTSGAGLGAPVVLDGPVAMTAGARALDPLTGLPTINGATGAFARIDGVAQRVYLAVRTTLASAGANKKLGTSRPRKISARFEAENRASILAALSLLTRAKVISIESITVNRIRPGTYTSTVKYFNLLTRKSEQVTA
jgi:hypothetical protein